MGWLIALAVLVGIGCIPVGAFVRYDAQGLTVKLVAGWLRLTLLPAPKKKKKESSKETAKEKPKKEPKPSSAGQEEEKGGSLLDFYPLVRLALDFLNQFRRKLRMDDLVLVLTLAGDDPCDLALNYGRAWEALGNLAVQLERCFTIRRRRMEVQCDFTSEEIKIEAQLKLTITIGRMLKLLVVYGFLFLKEFLNIKKKRKGGAVS